MTEPTGRALDALVAEKVMGLKWDETRCRVCGWPLASSPENGCVAGNCGERPAPARRADEWPAYSSDISAAWLVVEEMHRRGWWLSLTFKTSWSDAQSDVPGWEAEFRNVREPQRENVYSFEALAPAAICRAALAAVEATP